MAFVPPEEPAEGEQPVAVIGAGLVGCLAGLALARRGYRVNIFDSRPDPNQVEYEESYRSINLALSARGIEALRAFDDDMTERLLENAVPVKARMIHFADGRLASQLYGLAGEYLNSADRAVLNHSLIDEVRNVPTVKLIFRHKLVRCDFEKSTLTFELADGSRVTQRAAFVVGADGAYSKVREQMMRVTRCPSNLPHNVVFLSDSDPRMDFQQSYIEDAYLELSMPATPARDYAMCSEHLHIWPRHHFMLIALPNPDCSFTCTLFAPFATFGTLSTEAQQLAFFREYFADALPLIGEKALLRCFADHPKSPLVSVRCTPYHYADRAIILGDAAHAMLPFYGQGLNCGFEDVHVLLRLFEKHLIEPGSRVGLAAVFAEYTASRKPSLDAIQDLAADNFVEMRSSVASPLHVVRRRVDQALAWALGPSRWLPLYTMVTFRADLSYAEAKRRGEQQKRIVESSMWIVIAGLATGLAWSQRWWRGE